MAVQNNEVLGSIVCGECGESATVHQAKRGKKLLYTRCPECKADQRTGKQFQSRLMADTDWREGKRPDFGAIGFGAIGDWQPKQVEKKVEKAVENEPVESGSKPSGGAVFGVVALLGSLLGLVVLSIKGKTQ